LDRDWWVKLLKCHVSPAFAPALHESWGKALVPGGSDDAVKPNRISHRIWS
jgi:hypothetical protein